MENKDLNYLRRVLLERRREILQFRETVNASWKELKAPEKEAEEMAGKDNLSRPLAQLDSQSRTQLRAIDDAIARMDEGDYGLCEACGEPIAVKRLAAVPWAAFCIECAEAREALEKGGAFGRAAALDREEMEDAEMTEAIFDALNANGRVETEELDIRCKDGVVYMDGALPAKSSHRLLRQIIEDVLDFNEIVDNIVIDRQPWERRERSDAPEPEKDEEERILEGEEDEVDVHDALADGEPMTPPEMMRREDV